ncbi:MAG: plasmid replication, integration and excision activator [Nocardioidaceae bacterium]|nr:plasmid replication, integration and excision activator [Nocardioidaceae bacterium]NUS52485.1 plasmid replication, integration and excision activator [Nocardioidaceae bacterium]
MAMQKRIKVAHGDVFPMGAYLKKGENGPVEPVADFNAEPRSDGSRPQSLDRETGLPVWQVTVIDADEEASKKDTAVSVKFLAKHQPVPPENTTPFPMTPVEFTGLTALAWIDDNGPRPRIAWSYRAEEMVAPGVGSSGSASASSSSTASPGSGKSTGSSSTSKGAA